MARTGGPRWFKFWDSFRVLLDVTALSMEDRGVVITNAMRYFHLCCGSNDIDLLEMTQGQTIAFSVLQDAINESLNDYEIRSAVNRMNGKLGGRPSKNPPEAKKANGFSRNPIDPNRTQTKASKKIDCKNLSLRSIDDANMAWMKRDDRAPDDW